MDRGEIPYMARRFRTAVALVATTLMMAPLFAQTNTEPTSAKDVLVERLLRRVDELEASQKRMQATIDKFTVAPPLVAAEVPPVDAVAEVAEPMPAHNDVLETHRLGPVEFKGFSDFGFGRPWFEKPAPNGIHGSTNSFNIGDLDLFTNTRIGEHWNLLAELLVSSDFSNEFGAELDRLLLTYTANDYLKVGVGKFNTAIGYYPNAFHRAHYFQTATSRPLMFADEDNGGILPVHSIGVTATGKIPSGALGLHWVAEVANGVSHSTDVPLQNFVDENNGKAVNLAMYAKPDWLPGFQTGFSILRDTLHPIALPAIDQTIWTAHVVYVGNKLEWLNEGALVRHALRGTNQIFRTTTSYTQLSRAFGATRPYFRYDYQNIPSNDPIYGALERRSGPSIGVARHLGSFVVVKIQYALFGQRGLPSTNDVQAQLAIAF
jgi:hypothetical protein